MAYIVITSILANHKDRSKTICEFYVIDESNFSVKFANKYAPLNEIGMLTIQNSWRPLNFSVNRNREITQDSGSFSRFFKEGAVVLAEIANRRGRVIGYKLLLQGSGKVVNLKTEEIVNLERKFRRPFLQNGIVRNDTVNCYPLHKFPRITIKEEAKSKSTTEKRVKPVVHKENEAEFTKAQLAEINNCIQKGIDPEFIKNPKLSPEQMRVLWVSKSKGALSEYFARPDYSVEVMKFYADRLFNKEILQECSLMMHKPHLTVPQLSELYLCVCDGVDYCELCDKSAEEIAIERRKKSMFNNSDSYTEDDINEKAVSFAMRQLSGK